MKWGRTCFLLGMLPFLFGGCGAFPRIVILHDPLSSEEHLRLGERYEAEGKIDLALAEYESALKDGNPAEVFAHLGTAYDLEGETSRAESFYLKSLGERRDQPRVLNNLAGVYAGRGVQLEEAERMVKEAVRLDPEHRPYYLETLSEVFLAEGKNQEAAGALSDAERSAPVDPLLLRSLRQQRARLEGNPSVGSAETSFASPEKIGPAFERKAGSSISENR
jgi:tetratricopeptide (TPR) repeat protein